MSPFASSKNKPSSRDFAMENDYDPLLDYCEDYAWDPSDSEHESEDHGSVWDISDRDSFSFVPPQPHIYTRVRNNTSKDTLSISKILPPNFRKKLPRKSPMDQTFKIKGSTKPKQSKILQGDVPKVPRDVLDTNNIQVKDIHNANLEGNNSSCIGFGYLIYILFLKYYGVTKEALQLALLKMMKWIYFKWLFVVLNVVIEVCQATFTQENAQGKISTSFYLKSSITSSFFCLVISIIETIHEGKISKVVWRSKHGCFGWFYHPGRQRRLFGRFSLIFGIGSSLIQLCINVVALVINKDYLKFDMLPLLLSSGYLVAALIESRRENMTKSKCKVRESCLKACSWCKVRLANESLGSSPLELNSNFTYVIDESYGFNQFRPYAGFLSIKIRCK